MEQSLNIGNVASCNDWCGPGLGLWAPGKQLLQPPVFQCGKRESSVNQESDPLPLGVRIWVTNTFFFMLTIKMLTIVFISTLNNCTHYNQ